MAISRGLVPALATGLCAWLAWQVMVNISPRHLDGGNDATVLVTAGASSAALVRRMERQILEADGAVDWAEIRRAAQHILAAHPLQSRALFLLGLAAEAEGREDQATALMSIAAARSLRDRRAHLWLFTHRLRQRQYGPALGHADVILRTRPRLGASLLPALIAVASIPEARPHLIGLIEAGPPWRNWFLSEFSKRAADPSDPSPLYAALQAGLHPPSNAELRPHLDRLIGSGRFEQAFVAWLSALAPRKMQDLTYLYNGDFERPLSNLAFDWVISQVRGAEIDVSDSSVDKGRALRIQFARARVPFKHVRKLVMLPPGPYRLSGKARAVDLRTERGLVWKLSCAEGSREILASTPRIAGTATSEFTEQFTVPAQGCRAQWLVLELAARIPSEQDVGGGTVWYDSLQIQRVVAPPASQSGTWPESEDRAR
jgi:hypothetical protein